jgi:hypothetical protein
MKFRNMMLGMAIVGLAGSALAGGDVTVAINSEELGFDLRDLHGMQEGENRSIVDESGRNILITREADGFTLNIDGEIVELPMLFGGHHAMAWSEDGDEVDMNVHVMRRAQFAGSHDMDGTTIISRKPIDDATKQQIRLLLESAGYESDVNFIDREAAHGEQIIIKRIVETVESPSS